MQPSYSGHVGLLCSIVACCIILTAANTSGILTERPSQVENGGKDAAKGLIPLKINEEGPDGYLFVPESYSPGVVAPFLLLLHGARKTAAESLDNDFSTIKEIAESEGIILLVPDSRGDTWDGVRNRYGPDVDYIGQALKKVFTEYAIDSSRLGVGGFSDGATYALSLGVINGDLFTNVLGFSPGGIAPTRARGLPRIFISHGTADKIFDIERSSQYLVGLLQLNGYDVTYIKFDGGHYIPDGIAEQAMKWFLE